MKTTTDSRKYLRVVALVLIALLFLLFGCAPLATQYREDGFNQQWRGYEMLKAPPGLRGNEGVCDRDRYGHPGLIIQPSPGDCQSAGKDCQGKDRGAAGSIGP